MIIFTVVHCCINLQGCDTAHLWVMAKETLFFFAADQLLTNVMSRAYTPFWSGFCLFSKSIARMLIMSTASAALVGIAAVRGCFLRDSWNPEPAGCEALQYHAHWHEAVPTWLGSTEVSDRHKERKICLRGHQELFLSHLVLSDCKWQFLFSSPNSLPYMTEIHLNCFLQSLSGKICS